MKFQLTTFTAPEKGIPQETIDAVKALVEADNEDAALTLVFDIKDEGKEMRAFRQAAKDQGKTVRIRRRDESGVTKIGEKDNGKPVYQGEVTVIVTLTDKYKDGRGRKPVEAKGDEAKSEKTSK